MADVLQADTLHKLKKQRQGEEDPVIVAQRFLNIYRQLHIFGEDKKNAFNKMLLELKPEIRAVFGTIPGGVVIQDYIEELEEKEGIYQTAEETAPTALSENPQILAAALADTQTPSQQQPQTQAQQTTAPSIVHQIPVSSKLEIGKDFAKELAQALSASISMPAQAAAQEHPDMSPLISAMEQGQKEIINILRSETIDRKNENQNMAKMLLASQHQLAAAMQKKDDSKTASNYLEAFKSLAANQKQLAQMISELENNNKNNRQDLLNFFETSQQQFRQTLQTISLSQKNDTQALTEALGNSHKELAQILHQNNIQQNQQAAAAVTATNQAANNIQINSADYSGQLALIAERLGNLQTAPAAASLEKMIEQIVTAQSRMYQETLSAQTKELGAVIKLALKESQAASTEALVSALEKHPKTEVRIAEPVPYAPSVSSSQYAASETEITPAPVQESIPTYQEEDKDLTAQELFTDPVVDEIADERGADPIPFPDIEEAPKKKKKKKKKKNKTSEPNTIVQETPFVDDNLLPEPDDFITSNSELSDFSSPEDKSEDSSLIEQEMSPEVSKKEVNPFAGKSDVFQIKTEETAEPFESVSQQETPAEESNAAFDWGFNSQDDTVEKTPVSSMAASWNGDDDFASLSETTSEEASSEEEQQDWEWEYVDEADENAEWEWEYVEEGSDEDNDIAPIAQNAPIYHEDSLSPNKPKTSRKFVPGDVIDIGNSKIAIKDSKNTEAQNDPYQNNNLKP